MDIQKEYASLMEAYNAVYEKQEQVEENDIEEGFRKIPAGRQREAMMKRSKTLGKKAMDYARREGEAAGDDRVKMGKIDAALRDPKLREEVENVEEEKRPFPFKKVAAQQEKARKGSVYGKPATNEPAPNVSDKEKKETGRFSKMHQASEKAKREKQVADKARRSSTFYKDTHPASAPKMKKANEEVETDLFDTILEYLVAEGYADTNKAALAIMANMSEEWRQSIVEMGLTPDQESRRRDLSKAINKAGTPGYPGVNSPETRKMQGEYVQLQKLKGV